MSSRFRVCTHDRKWFGCRSHKAFICMADDAEVIGTTVNCHAHTFHVI